MIEKEDLGLTLSLNLSQTNHHRRRLDHQHHSPQLNLMPLWLTSSSHSLQKSPWDENLHSSDQNTNTCRGEKYSLLKDIDVNRLPPAVDSEEDGGSSSPNSTLSNISGKRRERETTTTTTTGDENELENRISDDEDGENSRKKLRLSKDQSAILEENFKEHNILNPKKKMALAKKLGLRQRQVEVWFQNRRARTKFKQTEVDCEFLKRCCENLTAENRQLRKEILELKALKFSPQFYMHMVPPTTLTMCPSCDRAGGPPSTRPTDSPNPSSIRMGSGPYRFD